MQARGLAQGGANTYRGRRRQFVLCELGGTGLLKLRQFARVRCNSVSGEKGNSLGFFARSVAIEFKLWEGSYGYKLPIISREQVESQIDDSQTYNSSDMILFPVTNLPS